LPYHFLVELSLIVAVSGCMRCGLATSSSYQLAGQIVKCYLFAMSWTPTGIEPMEQEREIERLV